MSYECLQLSLNRFHLRFLSETFAINYEKQTKARAPVPIPTKLQLSSHLGSWFLTSWMITQTHGV